ncbi:MAG: hypothetical protein F2808_01585 [Actinobacteria bacterium]|uniref:Unannotated protein n=1 Tax=freshwater metagenome TaxID=449393 RepID=A0A6J7F484_9ZZZZ|nr:hypothetical protein [Actinomycetota bacterium]
MVSEEQTPPEKSSVTVRSRITDGAKKSLAWAKALPAQVATSSRFRRLKPEGRAAKKSTSSVTTSSVTTSTPAGEKRPWSQLSKAEKKIARRRPVRTLWWWLSLTVLTSSGGFLFPAVALAFSVTEGWKADAQFAVLAGAGAVQGLVVGIGQAIALRRGPIRIPVVRWIVITTIGFALSWTVALVPGSVFQPSWDNSTTIMGLIAVVLLVILIVPIAQSFLLTVRVRDAWRWILVMGISTALGTGSFIYAIVLVQGKSTFIGTALPFIYMGWVGIMLYSLVSALGVFWIAQEAYSDSETRALIARRHANERKAVRAVGTGVVFVSRKTSPTVRAATRKATAAVGATAKKIGPVARALAQKIGSRTSGLTTRMRRQTQGSKTSDQLTTKKSSNKPTTKATKRPTKKVAKKKAQKAPEKP